MKPASRGSGLDIPASWLIFSATLLFASIEVFLRRPGYASLDERHVLMNVQLTLEGLKPPFSITTGGIERLMHWLAASALGPRLGSLHLAGLALFCAECALLWRLAQGLFGRRVAAGALIFNCLSAFTLLRARSLLAFTLSPCECLLVLNLLCLNPHRAKVALAGLLSGLFLLDYEAWVIGLPALLLISPMVLKSPGLRKAFWASALFSTLLALWLSRDTMLGWFNARRGYSSAGASMAAEWLANFKVFFLGGENVVYLGPNHHSSAPRWSLAFLTLGLFSGGIRRDLWLFVLLALGLAPLAAVSYGGEPNRAILAWPALALFAGLGWEIVWDWLEAKGPRLALLLLTGVLTFGIMDEALAFEKSMAEGWALNYGRGDALIAAAGKIREISAQGGVNLLSNLDLARGPELRFLTGPLRCNPASPSLAWIPDGCMIQFKKGGGPWTTVQPYAEIAPEYFLHASGAWKKRLGEVDDAIAGYEKKLPVFNHRQAALMIFEWLDKDPAMDPWVRTALWGRVLRDAALSGDIDAHRVDKLLKEPLVSADALFQPGVTMARSNPRQALRLLEAAGLLDPRRKLDDENMAQIRVLAAGAPR